MAGASGVLRLLVGLILPHLLYGKTGLPDAVAELEALVRAQNDRLHSLEAQVKRLPGTRRLALTGSDGTKSIHADSGRLYSAAENFAGGLDHLWLILCATLILFMQAGFSMIEAGSCRMRNVQNVLTKNLLDVCVSTVGWFVVGWSFAFSGPYIQGLKESGFLGWEQFAGHTFLSSRSDGQQEPSTNIVRWFVSWTYCCISATIATNGVAERANLLGYAIFTLLFSTIIFPFVVAWTWGGGWLADLNATGFYDYGGAGIVHLTGGVASLVGACIAGPREGRFGGRSTSTDDNNDFSSQSPPLVVLGTFILWFGWYGYIFSFTGEMHTLEKGMQAAQTAMNITIAACTSALVAGINFSPTPKSQAASMCSAIMAGLVSVSASAPSIESGTAAGLGVGGAVVYVASTLALKALKVDDPMDSFSIHGACGIWSLFGAATMDWGLGFETFHGVHGFRCQPDSTSTGCNTEIGAAPLLANLCECGAIIGWVAGLSSLIFIALKLGKFLRDDPERGFDELHHIPVKGFDIEDVMPKTSL